MNTAWLNSPWSAWGQGAVLSPRAWEMSAFALRAWAASMLALYLAYFFQLESPYWAWLTVWIVAQPTPGMLLSKSFYLVFGTIGGWFFWHRAHRAFCADAGDIRFGTGLAGGGLHGCVQCPDQFSRLRHRAGRLYRRPLSLRAQSTRPTKSSSSRWRGSPAFSRASPALFLWFRSSRRIAPPPGRGSNCGRSSRTRRGGPVSPGRETMKPGCKSEGS